MIARYRDERASCRGAGGGGGASRAWTSGGDSSARDDGTGRVRRRGRRRRDEGSSRSSERRRCRPRTRRGCTCAYVREERAGRATRVRLCDRGELHSALECSLCEAPRRITWTLRTDADGGRIAGDVNGGDPASVAAGELLSASGQAEVDRWRALTSSSSEVVDVGARLTRKGLVSFSDAFLDGFHGLTSLWLARNRLTSLPDLGRLTPLLERLEVSARETKKSCVSSRLHWWFFPEAPVWRWEGARATVGSPRASRSMRARDSRRGEVLTSSRGVSRALASWPAPG